MLTWPTALPPAMMLMPPIRNPASMNGADPPPRSSSSRVRLQSTSAFDLSVRWAALSMMRTGTP
jgi:hypothetical protein